MEKYSAAYSYTNYNFVVQNIKGKLNTRDKYYPLICVLKNILQRGCPTKISQYLTQNIGDIDLREKKLFGLIDNETPKWINTIKGDEENQDYPAKIFFEKLIPKYLEKYKFIQQLIIPEAEVNDVVDRYNEQFVNQKVDFYLPQCKLVIEIDGIHHNEEIQIIKDKERDAYLLQYGIVTVRIRSNEIKREDNSFIEKISKIESILSKYDKILEIYNDYKYIDDYEEKDLKHLKANAILRLQITILALLEKGTLKLDDEYWKINILNRDVYDFVQCAIEDLFIWFEKLCVLDKIQFNRPELNIIESRNEEQYLYKKDYINIDFSLNKRYTDENVLDKNIIYVRTDYYDGRRYFKVSSSDPIKYKIDKEDIECIKSLEFLLKNIFGHDRFRDGQLPIIINSLQGEDTIGILPTGTGKSICYQLTALLQPCISFVVCPIKSLIYDQKNNLNKNNINNIECVTGDIDGEEKNRIIKSFSEGKYQFIFISPERFQIKKFREALDTLNRNSTIAIAVIDEVHCLSEWGHDFRTSYLNLVKTIRRFAPSTRLLGLTATASNFVLQDIKKEFEVESYNVKTLTSFTREELTFNVIKCDENNYLSKKEVLFSKLKELDEDKNIFHVNGEDTNSGIIFTSTVNGSNGCHEISNQINRKFKTETKYFSGESPKAKKIPVMESKEYSTYKNKVQKDFKENKLPLLVATKAFGMGVDKPNIRYTIHFGMPMSLESLYQEAGRAGRDKNPANCYVLYEHESLEEETLNKFFSLDTSVEELHDIQFSIPYSEQKDILSNFFLWLSNNKGVEYEFKVIKEIFNIYINNKYSTKKVECKKLGYSLSDVQKAIYRLNVIGIIEDWTVEIWNSKKGVLEIQTNEFSTESVYKSMDSYIKKYHKEFDINILKSNQVDNKDTKTYSQMIDVVKNEDLNEYEKIIKALLIWVYDNIVYTRRQSIKTISELCNNFKNEEEFKTAIENNFKFDDDTFKLDVVAEKPEEYKNWFEVFTDSKGDINKNKINETKFTLSRFLESYRYNTGLNFISGMIRLVTSDYNNIDGRQRLESAFNQIKEYDEQTKNEILDFSLKVGNILDEENKIYLSELLCNNYDDKLKIHEALEDDHSLTLIIEDVSDKLKNISRGMKCQKREN